MTDEPPKQKHSEEQTLYLDVSKMNGRQFAEQKEKLENLYNDSSSDES